jgi:hypothetical protein
MVNKSQKERKIISVLQCGLSPFYKNVSDKVNQGSARIMVKNSQNGIRVDWNIVQDFFFYPDKGGCVAETVM